MTTKTQRKKAIGPWGLCGQKSVWCRLFFLGLLACMLLLSGCGKGQQDADERDNPDIRGGLEQAQKKNWDKAISLFQEALSEHPSYSRPNLELALIYHQQKKNYVRAIYHYERYLEKRPDTEKAAIITDWIRQAKILLAAEVGQSSEGISEEIIRLKRANNLLRKQLARMAPDAPQQKPPPQAAPAPEPTETPMPQAVSSISPEPTPVSAQPIARHQTPAPQPDTYKVLPGDSLSKIARVVYGDSSKWEEIYGANLDKMIDPSDLKAGQVIIIPTLKEQE